LTSAFSSLLLLQDQRHPLLLLRLQLRLLFFSGRNVDDEWHLLRMHIVQSPTLLEESGVRGVAGGYSLMDEDRDEKSYVHQRRVLLMQLRQRKQEVLEEWFLVERHVHLLLLKSPSPMSGDGVGVFFPMVGVRPQ